MKQFAALTLATALGFSGAIYADENTAPVASSDCRLVATKTFTTEFKTTQLVPARAATTVPLYTNRRNRTRVKMTWKWDTVKYFQDIEVATYKCGEEYKIEHQINETYQLVPEPYQWETN